MYTNEINQGLSDGLKRLRKERRLTQSELAKQLGLSQAHFSKIENGYGSITAEQLIRVVQKYSLPLSYFVPSEKGSKYEEDPSLQNALVYLGATHLRVIPNIVIPERLAFPEEAILEALIAPSSRLITALAPVIVRQGETINFHRIAERLRPHGFECRVWWAVDGTHDAIGERLNAPYLSRDLNRRYQRAFLLLERKKLDVAILQDTLKEDELDSDLISERTVQWVKQNRDNLAKQWHILTRIKKADFEQALKDSEET